MIRVVERRRLLVVSLTSLLCFGALGSQPGAARSAGAAKVAVAGSRAIPGAAGRGAEPSSAASASPIQHVVVVMLENHSFDNYFGSFQGANGIPSTTCVPDPSTHGCDQPVLHYPRHGLLLR